MKYVRLNYGKIEPTCDNKTVEQLNDIYKQFGLDQRAIVIADTIEELCDAVVRIKNDRLPLCFNMPTRATYKWVNNFLKTMIEDEDIMEIYGAIWTDKGLIYVAKMNKKGELELL